MRDNIKHIASAFDRDLETVQALVCKMGGLVEAALLDAARALETRDTVLAREVVGNDKRIDGLEEDINREAIRLIALRAPVSGDLRTVMCVIRMSAALERMGDLAKNMAKRTSVLADMEPIEGSAGAIRRMGQTVETMLRNALDAFVARDAALAEDVWQRDEELDQMYNALFRGFITHMMEEPRHITACMHLHFIAKNVERMGDHVTTIAEQVIYMVTGEMPDDDRPKGDTTSTMMPEEDR